MLLLTFNAVGALYGGYQLVRYPDGSALGLDPILLTHSPFTDFRIPGIILMVIIGMFNLVSLFFFFIADGVAVKLLKWQGTILLIWLVIQIIMIRDINYMHAVFGLIGLMFVLFRSPAKQ